MDQTGSLGCPDGAMAFSHEWSAAKLVGNDCGLLAPERAREAFCARGLSPRFNVAEVHFLGPAGAGTLIHRVPRVSLRYTRGYSPTSPTMVAKLL